MAGEKLFPKKSAFFTAEKGNDFSPKSRKNPSGSSLHPKGNGGEGKGWLGLVLHQQDQAENSSEFHGIPAFLPPECEIRNPWKQLLFLQEFPGIS